MIFGRSRCGTSLPGWPYSWSIAAEIGAEAVSYTHLDVYKRQVQALRLYRNAEIKAGVGKLSVKGEMVPAGPGRGVDDPVTCHGCLLIAGGLLTMRRFQSGQIFDIR